MENFNNKKPKDIDGTAGFSPQLAGQGKAGHSHTSGFQTPLSNTATAPAAGTAHNQKRDATTKKCCPEGSRQHSKE